LIGLSIYLFNEDGENPISAISFNLEIKASVFSKASGTF